MSGKISQRFIWAVETLSVEPTDHILEIGCGHGIVVSLLCDRLKDGTITAIDRSAKMIDVAKRRNSGCEAAGKAAFYATTLKEFQQGRAQYNKVFAINVNIFWQKSKMELGVIRNVLRTGGALYLFYQPPSAEKAREVIPILQNNLQTANFSIGNVLLEVHDFGALLCVLAAPSQISHS